MHLAVWHYRDERQRCSPHRPKQQHHQKLGEIGCLAQPLPGGPRRRVSSDNSPSRDDLRLPRAQFGLFTLSSRLCNHRLETCDIAVMNERRIRLRVVERAPPDTGAVGIFDIVIARLESGVRVADMWVPQEHPPSFADDERLIEHLHAALLWSWDDDVSEAA
jgi:hypothetical protein